MSNSNYSALDKYLDNTDTYTNTYTETNIGGNRILIVTQTSETDGGQLLFRWDGDEWQPLDADNFADITGGERAFGLAPTRRRCGSSSDTDHDLVLGHIEDQVDRFSSATGPDGGNLACVWAVRNIVKAKIGRWITRTDSTAIFDTELQSCYGHTLEENEVRGGGIIISPTTTLASGRRNIGHVGLLGPGGVGGGRLIYSNSSGAKKWKQNFTLDTWIKRYRTDKGLKVRFYPLPDF